MPLRRTVAHDDRELAMTIAQKRMESLRTIAFTTQTRGVTFAGRGLGATDEDGVTETVTNAGRSYVVNTVIQDLSFVPAGNPDEGAPTLKSIQISVTPLGAAATLRRSESLLKGLHRSLGFISDVFEHREGLMVSLNKKASSGGFFYS